MMMNRTAWLGITLCSALALGACSSARFGGGPQPVRQAAAAPAPELAPVEAVPSAPVTVEPLPPLDSPGGPYAAPGQPGDIAALPGQPMQPVDAPPPPSPSSRSSMVGGWTARDASGASCRVQLSSSPALDLYRASATSCANRDLARVTAWDFRNGEVYLYQTGGAVAARLRGSAGSLEGVLTKSGAPLTFTR